MSIDQKNVIDAAVKLPELIQEPAPAEPAKSSRRGGLLLGVGMVALLTLLVYLNMG